MEISKITCFLSDDVMFWIVQFALFTLTMFLFSLDKYHKYRSTSGFGATVVRSEKSMAKYYAIYASVNGLLVALALSVKAVEEYKVIISLADTVCCFYLFVLNQYMRNKIVELTGNLHKVESR